MNIPTRLPMTSKINVSPATDRLVGSLVLLGTDKGCQRASREEVGPFRGIHDDISDLAIAWSTSMCIDLLLGD